MPSSIPDFVPKQLEQLGLDISHKQLEQMTHFLDLLLEANKKVNLTAIRDCDRAWSRHIIDSLTILPWIETLPKQAKLIDVGTGGGLPGIPLAIAKPDIHITFLDATEKKIRCVQGFLEQLSLDLVTTVTRRAEDLGQDHAYREKYDVVTCRAIGPMRELLEYTLPLIKVGGQLLAMKGPKVEAELTEASDALMTLGAGEVEVYSTYPPEFDQDLVVIQITKQAHTPKTYPRQPGIPRQSPL